MSKRFLLKALMLSIPAITSAGVVVAQVPEPATAPQASIQNSEPEKTARKPRRPGPSGRIIVVPSQVTVAPQVVTVIHRLSGVKILRFFLRQAAESGVIETIDPQ